MNNSNLPPITEIGSHRSLSTQQIQRQRVENEFMHVHGSLDSWAIYRVVEALSIYGYSQKRLISRMFGIFNKKEHPSEGILTLPSELSRGRVK